MIAACPSPRCARSVDALPLDADGCGVCSCGATYAVRGAALERLRAVQGRQAVLVWRVPVERVEPLRADGWREVDGPTYQRTSYALDGVACLVERSE